MLFVSENGLSVEVEIVVVGLEFLIVLDTFEGVDGLGDVTGFEKRSTFGSVRRIRR